MGDREAAVDRIVGSERRMQQIMASDRSTPLLHSSLTMQQLKVLLLLAHSGGSSGHDLAGMMSVSLATMTGIVDRLVGAGLVYRQEDPRDRRVRRVTLTDSGAEAIDGIVSSGESHLLTLLDRLSDDEVLVVDRAMSLLVRAAAEVTASAGPDGAAVTDRL